MARASHQTWVPLRDNYFQTPLLSSKEKAYLVRKSCEAAQEVVERARSTGGPIQWRHVEKYNGVQIYSGQPRGAYVGAAANGSMSMCGVTSVPGSVKEVASLFDLSTTRAMKEFSVENRDLFYDAIVLYTLSPRTKEKPLHQVTAKWIVARSPNGLEDRDFCYLECQDKFIDSMGRKGWVMCLHSIKLPGCDDLTRDFGFIRGSFYHSGVIVVESDRPGYVDVIHMLQINFKNGAKVPPTFMRDRVAFVSRVRAMMRTKRLNEQRYLSDLELVPKKYRSRCAVCQDSFSLLLLRKMSCRKCGEVVCGACSKEFDITNAKFLESVKIRICMHCFQMITTAAKPQNAVMDAPRASTALSFLEYHDDDQRASFMTQMPSSAAEMMEMRATEHQQKKPKIFLQSMRRQPSSSSRTGIPPSPAPAPGSYHQGMSRSSHHRARPSSAGFQPSSTFNMYNMRHTEQGANPVSIFDRPTPTSHAQSNHHSYSRQYSYPTSASPVLSSSSNGAMLQRSSSEKPRQSLQFNRPVPTSSSSSSSASTAALLRQQHGRNSSFKIPPSLYDFNSIENDGAAAYPSPDMRRQRKRRDSNSSDSSTGSIDIDSYEGENQRDKASTAASSQEELLRKGSFYTKQHDEETKSQEFSDTPALPPPSPSAQMATKNVFARESIEKSSSHYEQASEDDERDSLGADDEAEAYERDSDIDLNTAGCDVNLLDMDMRQFHAKSVLMQVDDHGKFGFTNGSKGGSYNSVMDTRPRASPLAKKSFNARESSMDAAFKTSQPLLSTNANKTSPTSNGASLMIPPLHKGRRDLNPKQNRTQQEPQRQPQGTFALPANMNGDEDIPRTASEWYPAEFTDFRESGGVLRANATDLTFDPLLGPSEPRASPTTASNTVTASTSSATTGSVKSPTNEAVHFTIHESIQSPSRDSLSSLSTGSQESESMAASYASVPLEAPYQTPTGSLLDEVLPPPPPPSEPSHSSSPRSHMVASPVKTHPEPKISTIVTQMENVQIQSPPGDKSNEEQVKNELRARLSSTESASENRDSNMETTYEFHSESVLNQLATSNGHTNGYQQQQPRQNGSTSGRERSKSSDTEEEDEEVMLSARTLFKSYGSSFKITSLVGREQNDATFQRTFAKIQQSIDMLSSDGESEDDDAELHRKRW